MNASRLKEIVDLLLDLESQFGIQKQINAVKNNIDNIIREPQQPQHQTNFAESLAQLQVQTASLRAQLEPSQISLLEEIGASKYFVDDFAAQISDLMQKNPLTPAVTQKYIQEFHANRNNYIQEITRVRDSLNAIGIRAIALQPGDSEIGILLPRQLFDSNFEQLIKELDDIRFVLRAFSELTTGTVEPIKVRQISASDPMFFLGMNVETIVQFAAAVSWALLTWKQVEEIRKVRAETRKLNGFTEEEVESIFGTKIKKTIDKAVSEKLNSMMANIADKGGREKEQRKHLKNALKWLLSHIERGVTIQVRFIPPPKASQEEGKPPDIPQQFKTLQEIVPKLVFPKTEGPPILELPELDKDKPEKE